ncbi:MAG: photosynthetic reaction center cytochrome PufC [Candidatus Competibacteraceae bacterium]|jgi:photosynthetic reaction center cytochrome c subunit|nr:photosynthetic reaction center cytochrome PufC [Candidatus Competibacteraceae bacterium]
MKIWIITPIVAVVFLGTLAMMTLSGWDRPPIDTVQHGYRGTGMELVYNPRDFAKVAAQNVAPPEVYELEPSDSPLAKDIYENVEVLGDLNEEQFLRLMTAITEWVSPEEGCAYCHSDDGFAAENIYTKIVSRRMLQMTQHINGNWQSHVGQTGVTCYTCHRGQPVPQEIWFTDPGPQQPRGMAGNRAEQNTPAPAVALSSLPYDPFTPMLAGRSEIAVISNDALPSGNRKSIKQTEWTYGLMMHFSESLGVNCTYCHNSRSFFAWDQSPPQRTTAWHGIRMVNDLNIDYLEPLGSQYPSFRLGSLGDAPKTNCKTCHLGVYKPLFGANMVKDYPSLVPTTEPAVTTGETPVDPEIVGSMVVPSNN